MNRKKILLPTLVVVCLVFVVLLFQLTKAPSVEKNKQPNQTVRPTAIPTEQVGGSVTAVLESNEERINQGGLWRVQLTYSNLNANLQAADLILEYNPELVQFVGFENLNPNFFNPRALATDNRLILSFAEKQEPPVFASEIIMGEIVFRALAKGQASLTPQFSSEADSSYVSLVGSLENQLAPPVAVNIIIE
jgi:hypothetical protein